MKTRIMFNESWLILALVAATACAQTALSQSTKEPSVSKETALRNVLNETIVPGYRDLSAKCQALRELIETSSKAEPAGDLEPSRKAWLDVLFAARKMQWLQSGPIADREYLSWFYYSKVLPERIQTILNSPRAIDETFVAEFGSTARGLFALEHLLYHADPAGSANRRLQYALVLARELEEKAKQIAGDWSATGDQSAGSRFVAGGQQSLSLVMNELAQCLEQIAEQRLNFVLLLPQPVSRQLDRIEGSKSASSQQSVIELLQGARAAYHGQDGHCLEGYLRHLNGPLADRLNSQFESAASALQAIGSPLEQAAAEKRPLLQTAYEKTRALEVMFKVDVASAFGVTLTFSSNDGD